MTLRGLLHAIGPDLILLTIFLGVLLVIWGAFGMQPLTFGHGFTAMPPIVMGVLILMGLRRGREVFWARAIATVRDWFPLIIVMVIYDNFHDLTTLVRPRTVDLALRSLDERLFSVEPTLWLQRITVPWLTEYLSLTYAILFLFPLALLTLLYVRGKFLAFRELGVALSVTFYFGLIGYMLVPAIGPRYAFPHEFSVPLRGYLITDAAAAAWREVSRVDRDCFPSLHTALSTVALVYMWRHRALTRLFWGSLPLVVSLWFSTVYLRYHYTVDVIAGFVLAWFSVTFAPALVHWYYKSRGSRASLFADEPRRPVGARVGRVRHHHHLG